MTRKTSTNKPLWRDFECMNEQEATVPCNGQVHTSNCTFIINLLYTNSMKSSKTQDDYQ
jgi:hypothetical protein